MCTAGTVILCLTAGMSAAAAPRVMDDGGIFDAEYYAENNPDVVTALGTDEATLYQHYEQFGQSEGRLPYDPSTDVSALTQGDTTAAGEDYSTHIGRDITTDPLFAAVAAGDSSAMPDGVMHVHWKNNIIDEITMGTALGNTTNSGYLYEHAFAPGQSYTELKSYLVENGFKVESYADPFYVIDAAQYLYAQNKGWSVGMNTSDAETVYYLYGGYIGWTNGLIDIDVVIPAWADDGAAESDTASETFYAPTTDGGQAYDGYYDSSYIYRLRIKMHSTDEDDRTPISR